MRFFKQKPLSGDTESLKNVLGFNLSSYEILKYVLNYYIAYLDVYKLFLF